VHRIAVKPAAVILSVPEGSSATLMACVSVSPVWRERSVTGVRLITLTLVRPVAGSASAIWRAVMVTAPTVYPTRDHVGVRKMSRDRIATAANKDTLDLVNLILSDVCHAFVMDILPFVPWLPDTLQWLCILILIPVYRDGGEK